MNKLVLVLFAQLCGWIAITCGQTPDELRAINDTRNLNLGYPLTTLQGWADGDLTKVCSWNGITCENGRIRDLIFNNIEVKALPDSLFQVLGWSLFFQFSNTGINQTLPQIISLGGSRFTMSLLDLSNNNFRGNIPSSITQLNNLIHLNLEGNQFTGPIPSNIGNMQDLWILNLANNKLTGEFPPSLVSLTNLDTLNLANNNLSGNLPVDLNKLSQLQTLDLSGNAFTGPIPDLSSIVDLKFLYLQDNKFKGLAPSFLTKYVETANLTGVEFRCPIPSCDSGVECVLQDVSCVCPCDPSGGACVEGLEYCVCAAHRFGSNCSQTCPGTTDTNIPCSNNGVCSSGAFGSGICTCKPFYRGAGCDIKCPAIIENGTAACNGLGICDATGKCVCDGNRTGTFCDECISGSAGSLCDKVCPDCSGHGFCDDGVSGTGSCVCFNDYEGKQCEHKKKSYTGWLGFAIALLIALVIVIILLIVGGKLYHDKKEQYKKLKKEAEQTEAMEEFVVEHKDEQDIEWSKTMA